MRKNLRTLCLLLAFGLLFGCGSAGISAPEVEATPAITPAPTAEIVEDVVFEPVETPMPTLPPRSQPPPPCRRSSQLPR